MKKLIALSAITTVAVIGVAIFNGCVSTRVAEKTGSELWSDNCDRCHNAPGSSAFSADQWEAIGMHMRTRANLTEQETDKIVEFLKGAQ